MIGAPNAEFELNLLATYAQDEGNGAKNRFKMGEGLVGQAALEKRGILLTNVPGNYTKIGSGLGEFHPTTSWCCRFFSKAKSKRSWNFLRLSGSAPRTRHFWIN